MFLVIVWGHRNSKQIQPDTDSLSEVLWPFACNKWSDRDGLWCRWFISLQNGKGLAKGLDFFPNRLTHHCQSTAPVSDTYSVSSHLKWLKKRDCWNVQSCSLFVLSWGCEERTNRHAAKENDVSRPYAKPSIRCFLKYYISPASKIKLFLFRKEQRIRTGEMLQFGSFLSNLPKGGDISCDPLTFIQRMLMFCFPAHCC